MKTAAELRRTFEEHGQGHIFEDFEALSPEEQAELLADCEAVDFDWLAERIAQVKEEEGKAKEPLELTPAPVIPLPRTAEEKAKEAEARAIGEEALRAGRLAAFLVAGGQGTRLGYDGPKGCYPIGPVTGKTLFQWHAEQIQARARRYGTTIPWFVMTSRANDAATRAYFEANNYLGFAKKDVMFFPQAMVPSIDYEGRLIRESRSHLAMNPDGHGGSLAALVKSGAIAEMKKRGITTISYFQVDNPLVTICDPVFIGYHLQAKAEMSSKVLEKAYPEEKVGHICYSKGKLCVIEYSDLDEKNMYARDSQGKLVFWAGSIAIHMIEVDFVERIGGQARLPWHIAEKKIPYYQGGKTIRPDKPNGIKFETFVFDALPFTTQSVIMEVDRATEFAPVKNPDGVDSVVSCRAMLSAKFAKWLEAAGAKVPRGLDGATTARIEISPLYALDGAELAAKVGKGLTIEKALALA